MSTVLKSFAFSVLLLGVSVGAALACSNSITASYLFMGAPYGPDTKPPKTGFFPIAYGHQCAFVLAGDRDDGFGQAARDLGNRRVAQVVYLSAGCSTYSGLLVSNCKSRDLTWVQSKPAAKQSVVGSPVTSQIEDWLMDSEGQWIPAIAEGREAMVSKVNELGLTVIDGNGFENVVFDAFGDDGMLPFCGCKLFYPDSAGAKQ
ncbi:MAG: hypothetical protein AB8B51_05560 [Sedimentitalea sp.]